MTNLFIIAAGNSSRMMAHVPKPLLDVGGEKNISRTIRLLSDKFDKVYVVTNKAVDAIWSKYFESVTQKNVIKLAIPSGLGDGHALKQGFNASLMHSISNEIVVMWADTFLRDAEIVDELLDFEIPEDCAGVMPVVMEQQPYVTVLCDSNMNVTGVDSSKHGNTHASGWHDQSMFKFNAADLNRELNVVHTVHWKGNQYLNGELSLQLHLFHYLHNIGKPMLAFETSSAVQSFNTPEELAAIETSLITKEAK